MIDLPREHSDLSGAPAPQLPVASFHLICVHPFHGYARGVRVTDPDEVARLMKDRDHHFVRVSAA